MYFNIKLNEEQTHGREESQNETRETHRVTSISCSREAKDRSKGPMKTRTYFPKYTFGLSNRIREGCYMKVFLIQFNQKISSRRGEKYQNKETKD